MDEQRVIAIYGLSQEQSTLLAAAMPESYRLCHKSDVIDLIVTEAVCYIVNAETIGQADIRLLQSYYAEVGEYAGERIIWIGTQAPPEPLSTIFSCHPSFQDVLQALDTLLPAAWERYERQKTDCSEYSLLPARAIGDYLEQEIDQALHQAYGDTPDPAIVKRVRQEWAALLEVDGAAELAAAYELSLWLKKNGHPYSLTGDTASGLIPYLLGMTDVDPLPPHLYCPKCHRVVWKPEYKDGFDIPDNLCDADGSAMAADGHDLVWQEFCGYGRVPVYEFWLPTDMRETITAWLEGHWLQKWKPWEWENLRSDEPVYQRGNLAFGFDCNLDRSSISPDFHTRTITAAWRNRLIRYIEACMPSMYVEVPPISFAEALALLALHDSKRQNDRAFLQNGEKAPSDLITCREDVYFYLKTHGFTDKDAFKGMNSVRKGRGFPVVTEEMRVAPDHWILRQCEEVTWLPSKARLLNGLFFDLKALYFVDCMF